MTEQPTKDDLAGNIAKVEEDIYVEQPVVKSMLTQDSAAVETTVAAASELGHRSEDVLEFLEHLWKRGVGVFLHSQPAENVSAPLS